MLKTDTIINGDCLEVLKVCRMKVSIVVSFGEFSL